MSLFLRRRILTGGFVPITAVGGNVVTDEEIGGVLFRIHVFTTVGSSQAFEVQSLGTTDGSVEAFVVGGGGAGLNGGGAGGFTTTGNAVALVGSNAVVVGRGGLRSNFSGVTAESGLASSVLGIIAGGGGGAFNSADGTTVREGGSGGSGGGASASSNQTVGSGGSDGSNGGSGQRGSGGSGQGTTTREFGQANATLYSGGGGAGIFSGTAAPGGAGGGGNGVTGRNVGGNGVNGLGGGGGGTGGANSGGDGGNGGSGIVIVRYPLQPV